MAESGGLTRMSPRVFALALILSLSSLVVDVHGQPAMTLRVAIQLNPNGPLASLLKKSLEIQATKVNKEGGVLGKRLELIFFDEAIDASAAALSCPKNHCDWINSID